MTNLSTLNKKILISTAYLNNPDSKESIALNSRRTKADLNTIADYTNNILYPLLAKVASGERFPYDASTYGLGGSTLITYLESAGNNSSNTRLYWVNQRPTTIKESFDFIQGKITELSNLVNSLRPGGSPDLTLINNQLDDLYQYILQLFKETFGNQNESHQLQNPAPNKPEYTLSNILYHLYNQLIDVSLNDVDISQSFLNITDKTSVEGLTLSLKDNLFVTQLENLTDVDVSEKTDTQVLSWDEASNKWIAVDKDSGPQGPAGADGEPGADALWNYRGEYGIGDSYAIGDVVTYDGRTWYRKDANGGNVGDTPSIGLYWDLLADKGSDGSVGQDALWNFRGAWDIETTYEIGDVVQYLGSSYYKYAPKQNPFGDDYPTMPSSWQLVVSKGENGIAGSQGPQGEPGPQGPEGPTGSITLLSDVYDLMNPVQGDVLKFTYPGFDPLEAPTWTSGKVILGINTQNDYVSSIFSTNSWITTNSLVDEGTTGSNTVNLSFNEAALIENNKIKTSLIPEITLGSGTTGNYVSSLVAGTGIALSNNTGESATPTIALASGVTSIGTYKSVTVDTYGRVTSGTNPTTLAGYGITDAQPLDATLTALAGVVTNGDQIIYSTASDTFSTTTLSSFGRTLIDDADAITARTTLGLTIGTNVQAYDADLSGLAALNSTGIVKRIGAGTFSTTTNLTDLSDVTVDVAPAVDDVLVYTSTNEWKNVKPSEYFGRTQYPMPISGYFEGHLFDADVIPVTGSTQQSVFSWKNYTGETVLIKGFTVIVGDGTVGSEHEWCLYASNEADFLVNAYTQIATSVVSTVNAKGIASVSQTLGTPFSLTNGNWIHLVCLGTTSKNTESRITTHLHSYINHIL